MMYNPALILKCNSTFYENILNLVGALGGNHFLILFVIYSVKPWKNVGITGKITAITVHQFQKFRLEYPV